MDEIQLAILNELAKYTETARADFGAEEGLPIKQISDRIWNLAASLSRVVDL